MPYTFHMIRRTPFPLALTVIGFLCGVCAAFFSIHPVFAVAVPPFDLSPYEAPPRWTALSVVIKQVGDHTLTIAPIAPLSTARLLHVSYDSDTIFRRVDIDAQAAITPGDVAANTPALVWIVRSPGELRALQVIVLGYI
jgi:hypothetical protein